ncbi:uncharacterized protein DEA37_0003282 [Paragonimus westermani]|uniref:SH3 domain-containing protein n=1 Tax=Paragonimus westermani TaxID=34504 RepID=A0A5J4P3T1_9TREM|nr:uncharacterized protein DEA37_0003282 [Paragonimus westermani]
MARPAARAVWHPPNVGLDRIPTSCRDVPLNIRPFEAVASQTFDEADRLGLESGDVVVVLDGRPDQFWWRGQNKRTGELGAFPRSIVKRYGNLSREHYYPLFLN